MGELALLAREHPFHCFELLPHGPVFDRHGKLALFRTRRQIQRAVWWSVGGEDDPQVWRSERGPFRGRRGRHGEGERLGGLLLQATLFEAVNTGPHRVHEFPDPGVAGALVSQLHRVGVQEWGWAGASFWYGDELVVMRVPVGADGRPLLAIAARSASALEGVMLLVLELAAQMRWRR